MFKFSASLFSIGVISGLLCAASPSMTFLMPHGGQRGTDVVVNFGGARLTDAQELLIYYPGIAVKSFKVINATQVQCILTIAPDCRLGEHVFRIRTASGITEARTYWVGALTCVDEKEPNSEFGTPQPIALNSTVHGSIGGEDVDYFVVDCKKGQRLSIEIEAQRLGAGFWDPFIAIMNDKRFELVTSDDSPMIGQDGRCSIICPNDGKYTVMVREASNGGGVNYRLHVGTFPLPSAVVPSGGKPGEEIEFRFLGDPMGEIKQKIKLPAVADENFRLHCQTSDGIMPSGFKFRFGDLSNTNELPTDLDPKTAQVFAAPGAYNGVITKADEMKHVRFSAKKGQIFDIHCYARRIGSPLDSVLHLYNCVNKDFGPYITGNDDAVGPDSYLRFNVPVDAEYILRVHDHLKKGGVDYFFRVEITPVVATTSTNIPKVNGNDVSNQERQVIAVPKGGRFATMVNVSRSEWGGPANLTFPGLPGGMTAVTEPVEPGSASVPVVFEAKPEAVNASALIPFLAMPADPKVIAKPLNTLDVNYNIALNNTPFHRLSLDRMAVAVIDAAPYSIEVIEPKIAIPQNAAYNLKIVAKRAANFKGAIAVYPLFTPPGMGIAGSAVIPEGQTECLVYVNAAPNAGVRKWKTAMLAVADAGQGPVWTSSQLFTLEVQPPMVAFAQERGAVEQGQATSVYGKLTVAVPFAGEAVVKLIGLPAKVTAPDVKINKDSKEIAIPVTTVKDSPAGKHGTYCTVVITHNGETIVQNAGGGELRIDVPLPPKVAVAPMPSNPMTPAAPAPVVKPPEKRLTRLEQLRLEQEEREKAAKGEKK